MNSKREDLPLPETRRAVSYAMRALEVMAKLSTIDFLRATAILQRLIEVEIGRRNQRAQEVRDERSDARDA